MSKFDSTIINPEIEQYIEDLTIKDEEALREMHDYAIRTEIKIVGPLVGKFLYQIALITKPESIFELGSGFGYSAYWFAKALLGSKGFILCSDYSTENRNKAYEIFKNAGMESLLKFECGNSLDILRNKDEKFDIIFNDVDKEYYADVIDIAYDRLARGGLLITDNVLWYGKVIGDDDLPSTQGVRKYNEIICNDKRFDTTMLSVRDGISISYKK